MALVGKAITVVGDAAATLLYNYPFDAGTGYDAGERTVFVNNTSANIVYIGGPGVTDGVNGVGAAAGNHGVQIAAGISQLFDLHPGDALYVFAHVTSIIQVLTQV